MTTPAEIARSLTDAQRRALEPFFGRRQITGTHIDLVNLGLFDMQPMMGGWAGGLTPLGLQVRQILQEQNNADV